MNDNHILVDPYVLALRPYAADQREYIAVLVAWLRALLRNRDRCSFSEACLARLMSSGLYPTGAAIARILTESKVDDVSVVDVLNLLRPVSETEPFLERRVGIRSIGADEWTFQPDVMVARLPGVVAEAFREAVVMALFAHNDGWASDGIVVASTGLPLGEGSSGATVAIIEMLGGRLEEVNRRVEGVFELVCKPDTIDEDLSLEEVYRDPSRAALLVYRTDIAAPGETELDADKIMVSPGFVASLELLNIHRRTELLRIVYRRIVLAALGRLHNVEGASLHPVRTNSNADAPQVVRADGARLWRCMVTQRGAGYRLHYWTLSNNRVELDRVTVEHDV